MARFPNADAAGSVRGPPDGTSDLLLFMDPGRTEPDRAVQDLLDRADEALRTQGRLREVFRAVLLVGADATSPVVLDRLVTAARDLSHARHAALAMFDAADGPPRFRPECARSPASEASRACGTGGRSVVRQLADAHQPLRIEDSAAHVIPIGWMPGPAPLRTFLGVPIRVRGKTMAALCLGDKTGPGAAPELFSDEDEEQVQVLARAAGLIIDNARLFQQTWRETAWLHAATGATAILLTGADTNQALAWITDRARCAADADLAAIAVPESDDRLVIVLAAGQNAPGVAGRRLPRQGSLCGRVLTSGTPRLSSHLAADERALGPHTSWSAHLGPAMLVPLADGESTGVLLVTRRPGRPAFDEPQLGALAGFAAQTTFAWNLAAQRNDTQSVARLQDPERIAQALHDRVVTDVFGIGLTLNSLAVRAPGDLHERILETVDRLDGVVKDIRATVLALQSARRGRTWPENPGP
ncbi:GAF domain-containing protein [Streptomyces sp. NPDC002386]